MGRQCLWAGAQVGGGSGGFGGRFVFFFFFFFPEDRDVTISRMTE